MKTLLRHTETKESHQRLVLNSGKYIINRLAKHIYKILEVKQAVLKVSISGLQHFDLSTQFDNFLKGKVIIVLGSRTTVLPFLWG